MTAIVSVLNSQAIAIAADSAVTVTGQSGKKVYNRSNKIFTLSKYYPVGIAIYNSANLGGIPLETLIKMYRKKLNEDSFNTLEEYKADFIAFIKEKLNNLPDLTKRNNFYGFCSWAHLEIIRRNMNTLIDLDDRGELDEQMQEKFEQVMNRELDQYLIELQGNPKANYCEISFEDYLVSYEDKIVDIENYIEERIKDEFSEFTLTAEHRSKIKRLLYELLNIEFIFESYGGLVFFGFGEEEIFPSSHHILVGSMIGNDVRIRSSPPIEIQPGLSNIVPYAQGDVTTTVLTGVDPNYKEEVKKVVKRGFDSASQQIATILANPTLSDTIRDTMANIADELIEGLEEYQREKITGPLLDVLAFMGKEDMSELAESLVNITSLKRKFSSLDSSEESVGGPVDVAIVTKGDGFIWMKRKHYFDSENNPSFNIKYLKS